jgi:hypothetical protein
MYFFDHFIVLYQYFPEETKGRKTKNYARIASPWVNIRKRDKYNTG